MSASHTQKYRISSAGQIDCYILSINLLFVHVSPLSLSKIITIASTMDYSTLLRFIAAHIVPQTTKNHQSASFYLPITKQTDQLLSAANQPVINIVAVLMSKHPVFILTISQPIWL